MATIQKTIQVPENHRITIDLPLPDEIPAGDVAEIIVTIDVSRKKTAPDSILELAGALANSEAFAEDSVKAIRKVRDEW